MSEIEEKETLNIRIRVTPKVKFKIEEIVKIRNLETIDQLVAKLLQDAVGDYNGWNSVIRQFVNKVANDVEGGKNYQ